VVFGVSDGGALHEYGDKICCRNRPQIAWAR
jgi:hypothetical protein